MKTVGIIGLGLIGGSIAAALKQKAPETLIIAYNRDEKTLEKALKDGVIDHPTKKINEAFAACELIFICVPVNETARIAEQLKKHTTKNTVVTDVGSTKATVCETMKKHCDGFTFIGGHPMAGSERSGYGAARHYLFENAYYLLTPYEGTPQNKLDKLTEIIKQLGAIPVTIDAEAHDLVVGAISHVPHVVAMSLVNAVSGCIENRDTALTLASGGFKDITRIASSSPKMWNDISLQNKDNILRILDAFRKSIGEYEESLRSCNEKELMSLFEQAKSFRDEFKGARRLPDTDIIRVDLEDKPGGIAFVTTVLAYNNINIKSITTSGNRDFEQGILEIAVESLDDMKKGKDILRKNGLAVYD